MSNRVLMFQRMFKLLVSAFIASILILPLIVAAKLAGAGLEPLYFSFIYLGLLAATYLSIGKVAKYLLKRFYNITFISLDEYEWPEDEAYSDASDDENLFMVWSVIRALHTNLSSDKERGVVLVVHDEGTPISAYPMDKFFEELGGDAEEGSDVEAYISEDGDLIVSLSLEYFRRLLAIVSRGEGELGIVESMGEARALYDASLAMTRALYRDLQGDMALYVAYKAVVKLARKSLKVPEKMLEDLIPMDRQKKAMILEQLREEI